MLLRLFASLLMLFVVCGSALSQALPIPNGDFEFPSAGPPSGWTIDGKLEPGNSATIDRSVAHSGAASFRVSHAHAAAFAMTSAPVALEIGRLYRLCCWIKSEGASADPTSRYPTAVAATLTMESFPFTNNATVVGGTSPWTKVEVLFFATQREDQAVLRFGYNGNATGTAWFDDCTLEQVDDISAYIPLETVRWFGPAFRYTDKGWTFVHCEGKPYARGYQYGTLLSREIVSYMDKLAIRENADNPVAGWGNLRTLSDALMLRKFDPEYLEEMKGIADGAAHAGGMFRGRVLDLLDIVTVNCAVDLGQLGGGLAKLAHPLSGRSFRPEEDELNASERLHKCSSFLANGPATSDGRIVFGQLFMWNGYTGVHWDVLCDMVPDKGHHLVYETFPGGIHSGADFYINDAGIMIGETTVAQTPFNPDGEPQSSRIRKAAQYGESIDEVVSILTKNNNGLYTNDWLIGDAKTDEIAILLLGTKEHKVWRSSRGEFPGGTSGFYWSDNNAKDPEVRKEYVLDPTNAPFDVVYSPVNRDIAFMDFYARKKGTIDSREAVTILASSPINRPHACDGKVTTSAMAEKMVFLANYGKVTMREKVPEKNSRLISDLPGAIPHLSLGYSAISPLWVVEKLEALRPKANAVQVPRRTDDLGALREAYAFDKRLLWMNTVFPASESDNWFVSGSAAYWGMLNALPLEPVAAMSAMRDGLGEINCRLLYTLSREAPLAPVNTERRYDRYGTYVIPRIRGTYLLHQMRLRLGNEAFAAMMGALHTRFQGKPMRTADFLAALALAGGDSAVLAAKEWVERSDMPDAAVNASWRKSASGWTVTLRVRQQGKAFAFISSATIETAGERIWKRVPVSKGDETFSFDVQSEPVRVLFNAGNDIPLPRKNFYTFSNFFDDSKTALIVYGSGRHIEANHSAALRLQTVLADQFTETFAPICQDAEVTDTEVASHDLIVLGGASDNALLARLARQLQLSLGRNFFRWQQKTYGEADDGLFVALPNPLNPVKAVYLFCGNSALEVYQMTKRFQGLPSWAIWKGDQPIERGYLFPEDSPAGGISPGQ